MSLLLKLKSAFKSIWTHDWTNAWAGVKAGTGILLGTAGILNEFITVPEMHDYVQSLHLPHVGTLLIVLSAVTYVSKAHNA